MKRFIILLDSRFRGNDKKAGMTVAMDFRYRACAGTGYAGMTKKQE